MTQRLSWPSGLQLGLLVCLAAASMGDSATTVPIETVQERSSVICASPHRCPLGIARAYEEEPERVAIPTPTPTPTPTHHIIKVVSGHSAPFPAVTSPAHPLQRRDDLGSLLENLNSLSLALVLASASALSLSQDLNESLAVLRASTASLAASASSKILALEASASNAVSAVESSAASALSAAQRSAAVSISGALGTGSPTGALPTAVHRDQTEPTSMAGEISITIAAIAIAVSGVGSALLAILIFYLVVRRRRVKQQERQQEHEEETEVNAALDRAIVSYIVKELPSPQGPSASKVTQYLEPTMTSAMGTQINAYAADGPQLSPRPQTQPPAPVAELGQSIRRTQSAPRTSHRRTASSHFTDSAERVYANILATPLEHTPSASSSRPPRPPRSSGFTPEVRRDDIGWPLAKQNWL